MCKHKRFLTITIARMSLAVVIQRHIACHIVIQAKRVPIGHLMGPCVLIVHRDRIPKLLNMLCSQRGANYVQLGSRQAQMDRVVSIVL
ncbi:MAG: hypothetical protein CMF24_08710 [Ilumatobacter sp.]|nr:hypothetical protein [Ilumatobacter sp.]